MDATVETTQLHRLGLVAVSDLRAAPNEQPDEFAIDEPGFGPGVAARARLVEDLDPTTLFGMQLAVERCWQDGVTEAHLVLAEVVGTAASLGAAVVDPAALFDHDELGPWLRDEWPDSAADRLDALGGVDHESWKVLGFSPSEKVAWEQRGVADAEVAAARRAVGSSPDSTTDETQIWVSDDERLCDDVGRLLYRKHVTAEQACRMLCNRNLICTDGDGIRVLSAAHP